MERSRGAHPVGGQELLAQAEVGEHHVAGRVEQHVLELQVAVDHAELHTQRHAHAYDRIRSPTHGALPN